MKLFIPSLTTAMLFTLTASAAIVERRNWIETAAQPLKEEQCQDKMKTWRCVLPDAPACEEAFQVAYNTCAQNVLPDLPEYIDGADTKAQANKILRDCMTTEVAKKYVLPLNKEKMEEYNVCTGVAARSKPLNPTLQKALVYSKTLMAANCANGSFYRKCYALPEGTCTDTVAKHALECTMKMEADGVGANLKGDETAVQETGRKIVECTLPALRKEFDGTRKKLKDKDCS